MKFSYQIDRKIAFIASIPNNIKAFKLFYPEYKDKRKKPQTLVLEGCLCFAKKA